MDLVKVKSFWRDRGAQPWSFLCPHCSAPRKMGFQPRPTRRHFAQIAMTAVFFTYLTWSWFTWKGIIAFVPMWTIFEVVHRTRVRGALPCQQCGFDPYLYLTDVKRARAEIESHWRKKFAEKNVPYPERPEPKEPAPPPSSGKLVASSVRKVNQHTR